MKYVMINGTFQNHNKDSTNEDVINGLLFHEMIISIAPNRPQTVTIQYIDKKLSVIELEVKW